MLKEWEERSPEIAALLNPAFCASLIIESVKEDSQIYSNGFPFEYPFIMLPLVLHKPTRDIFPRSVKTTFVAWMTNEKTSGVKIGFAERAKSMVAHVRESLLFALQHECLKVSDTGLFIPRRGFRFPLAKASDEVKDCLRTSRICGKWFSGYNDIRMAMILLGVRP